MLSKRFAAILLCAVLLAALLPFSAFAADKKTNLTAGLKYTVEKGEPVSHSYARYTENGREFDVDEGQLTDQNTALTSESSGGWYRAFRSRSRLVGFDLGRMCAIDSVKAGFLNLKTSGIYAPRYINVWLSLDGENYAMVYTYENGFPIYQTGAVRCDVEFDLPAVYKARYVKIEFCCDVFCYCDEIGVYGSYEIDGSEAGFEVPEPQKDPGYLGSVAGVKNIIKIYNGYYHSSQSKANNTKEELIPYVAYVNGSGEIVDTMFDSVAFVPCHGDYPSGGRLVKTNGKPGAVASDWELYLRHTFAQEYDLHALDEAVGEVWETLGRSGKFKVFLTMPFPTIIDKAFGDIDGDGEPENCETLEERVAIIKWFGDKCISEFAAAEFENLELAGFYWYREEVNYSESDHEAELVKEFNRYTASKGLSSLFDPFYLSTGFDHWKELGFTGAVMQPNAAFTNSTAYYFETEMLGEFAQSAARHCLGVEIETAEPSAFTGTDYLAAGQKYESYLYYGAKCGYMSALKTCYQGAGPGSLYNFCTADVSTPKGIYLRRLYDITYKFLKGEYVNDPPVVAAEDFETVSGARRTMVDLDITDNDSYWGDITVEFPQMPQHGYVAAASGKKSLVYTADEDYVGEDSFSVVVSDGFNKSEELVIRVNVTAPAPPEEHSSFAPSESSGTETRQKQDVPFWLIAVISAMGLAVIAVAAVLILKKTRRGKA